MTLNISWKTQGTIHIGHVLAFKNSWTEHNGMELNVEVLRQPQFKHYSIDRITMTSENGRGTLIIRDVKESDQGAYTCEAINAKGLVFAIPDGVLSLSQRPNPGTVPGPYGSLWTSCVFYVCSRLMFSFPKRHVITTDVILSFARHNPAVLWAACCDIVVWWLWLLNPDGGGLTILCLPCRSCPVVSSSSYVLAGNCRDGHFSVGNLCMPCFCFGITKNCQSTGRYRSQIGLRFTEEEDFKGTQMIKIQRFAFICGFYLECNWMVSSNFGGDFFLCKTHDRFH